MIFILAFKNEQKRIVVAAFWDYIEITRDEVPFTFSRPGITNLYILSFFRFFLEQPPPSNTSFSPFRTFPFKSHHLSHFGSERIEKVSKDKNSHAHLSLDGNSCSLSSYFLVPFTIFLSRHHAAKRRLYFTCCLHLIFFHKQVHFSGRYTFQHLQLFLHGRSELVDSFLFQSQFAFFPPLPLLLCSLLVQAALSEFSLK